MKIITKQMLNSKDSQLLKKGLSVFSRKEVKEIFPNEELINKVVVLAFDHKSLFALSKIPLELPQERKFLGEYLLYEINHKLTLEEEDISGWWNGIKKREFLPLLPKEFVEGSQLIWPRISGPLPSLFFQCHQVDIYSTPESFYATLIHEFAHAYFDAVYHPWHGIKEQNLKILETAKKLFQDSENYDCKAMIELDHLFSLPRTLGETFAFCAEYSISQKLWPKYQKAIDQKMQKQISFAINKEGKNNLNCFPSVLDQNNHFASAVFGKIIMTRSGLHWLDHFIGCFLPQSGCREHYQVHKDLKTENN